MKKYIVGLICSSIIFMFFIGTTIYELINISKFDQEVISNKVESTCNLDNGVDKQAYECKLKYDYEFEGKNYTCYNNVSSAIKIKTRKNEKIFFSSSNPTNCSVRIKSQYMISLIIFDFIFLIIIGIQYLVIKRMQEIK